MADRLDFGLGAHERRFEVAGGAARAAFGFALRGRLEAADQPVVEEGIWRREEGKCWRLVCRRRYAT